MSATLGRRWSRSAAQGTCSSVAESVRTSADVARVAPGGRTRRRRRVDGELTWRRVIDAAVATILEMGYYQASSNEIARRAGVTWGALQHQFGTREGLLLEVLNDAWATLHEQMLAADVAGATLEER